MVGLFRLRRVRNILGWCCVVAGLFSCTSKVVYQYAEGKVFGTTYHISYTYANDLQAEIREEMERVNGSLSMFNPESVISKINRGSSDSTDVLFRRMFETAKVVHANTEGAFDITVAPLVNAWGFGYKEQAFPDSARIDSLLVYVGMDKIDLQSNRIMKKYQEMELDASSIAKGLGVDLVAEYFEEKGISNYMVEIGGEVRVKGKSNKDRPWRIGIDSPEDDRTATNRQLQLIIGISEGALATSGNYRNFYIREGKKYAHTIHPKTGFPVQTEVLGASVYAPSCMEADAYATAFMVMGLERAKRVLEQQPELEGGFIYQQDGKIQTWISPGLRDKIVSEIQE